MSKILAAAGVLLCFTGAVKAGQTPAKKVATVVKPLCADDVCLKLRQAKNIAMDSAKIDVILTGEDERRKVIESAQTEMIKKTKAYRDEIRPL